MPNPYLVRLREQHDQLHASIEGVQTRAAEGNRELSEEELRSVTEQATQMDTLTQQIEQLVTIETRSRRAGELAASLGEDPGTEGNGGEPQNLGGEPQQNRSRATTRDRDPGHYRSAHDGGHRSFFADHYRARMQGDREAQQRLDEHMRAVTQTPGGDGIVPPRWLVDEYDPLARQARAVANVVRQIPLGRDPRPLTLPKQTAGTDPNIVNQSAEGANTAAWGTDRFATDTDTLTPVTKAAYQDVSRQLLDSSSPAVDSLIFGDLHAAWDAVVESLVCAAILAGGTATGATFATEAAFSTDADAIDAVIDAQTEVAGDQRGPADLAVMNFRRFGAYRKLKDSTNRPLMPVTRYGPANASGALGNQLVGDIEGVDVIASAGVPTAYAEKYAVLRRQAVMLAESDVLDFSYEQVVGPSAVRMGIWGYVGALVRNPNSVAVLTVTAATAG
ncbi:phage major capsid protein [Amycolatopsis jiangsuensis]|uniref:HK97 family phage major capsid protein n=1 Tax=Amycolatopsis jiangsuensis TaxID=1181879 RepID=A0A840J8T3_9PSEU|nr:phage major capsid protein [Amycolatopsis jiangsuensis]MBB4689822.1 HK97 family phage major capsid protein [Amycolatopsis jiangsuensis]